MPTTCGFPNCKFRSRYRGSEDNRHFYRVPKKPQILRSRWLEAIGRNEDTIVSQLRVCSGHFHGGEKQEGDIPVADPATDPPLKVDLPPKTPRSQVLRRHTQKRTALHPHHRPLHTALQSPTSSRHPLQGLRAGHMLLNHSNSQSPSTGSDPLHSYPNSAWFPGLNMGMASSLNLFSTTPKNPSLLSYLFMEPYLSHFVNYGLWPGAGGGVVPQALSMESSEKGAELLSNIPRPTPTLSFSKNVMTKTTKPLVAILDEAECNVELDMLKDEAVVAFCDAHQWSEVHPKVMNEAVVITLWGASIHLSKENLKQFRKLKVIVKLGHTLDNIDLDAVQELGISVRLVNALCVESAADHILCQLLSLHKGLFPNQNCFGNSDTSTGPSSSSASWSPDSEPEGRLRNKTLGLFTLGQIGIAVIQRARVFGLRILVFEPNCEKHRALCEALGIETVDNFPELLARSDFLSVHCVQERSTNPKTVLQPIFTAQTFKMMKPGSYLISIASHRLIDEAALCQALNNGHLAGAALDSVPAEVWISPSTHPLSTSTRNLLLTCSVSGYEKSAALETRRQAAEEVKHFMLHSYLGAETTKAQVPELSLC